MLKESEGKQAIKANTDKKALNTNIFSATHTYNLFFSLNLKIVHKMNWINLSKVRIDGIYIFMLI